MIISNIDLIHTSDILVNQVFRVSFANNSNGATGSFQVKNLSGATIPAEQFGQYFKNNAIYNQDDFEIIAPVGSNTFTVKATSDLFIFANYQGFNTNIFGLTSPFFSGYTFDIYTTEPVTIPENPPLPIEERTAIDNPSKIKFCNSPIFIRETGCERVLINLYVWTGALQAVVSVPIATLDKIKVSQNDSYISVEISDLIKPYINPQFAYNRAAPPAITTQGVFVQAQIYKFDSEGNFTETFTPSYFVTLGYLWNYEQNLVGSNGVNNYGADGFLRVVNKYYNPQISNYFKQTFNTFIVPDFATTENIINYTPITPPVGFTRCSLDPCLIVFLNKLGLWESFTPFGKFTASTKIDRTDSNISHRDPSQVDNTFIHSKLLNNIEVLQSYIINTGSLTEDMNSIIEELIYSPKVYLIKFLGDTETATTVGITIDSTLVTIDSTEITIDSQTITAEYLGQFKTHQQIPVVVSDSDYQRKTRVNDKINIDYNIKFEETNNKINSIR
jgi:hypothetical protein